jgi:hypothetical protein
MEELKLTGNHLKGYRPILTFSSNFEKDTLETIERDAVAGIWLITLLSNVLDTKVKAISIILS